MYTSWNYCVQNLDYFGSFRGVKEARAFCNYENEYCWEKYVLLKN